MEQNLGSMTPKTQIPLFLMKPLKQLGEKALAPMARNRDSMTHKTPIPLFPMRLLKRLGGKVLAQMERNQAFTILLPRLLQMRPRKRLGEMPSGQTARNRVSMTPKTPIPLSPMRPLK
jgi:hypothetical protein